MAKLTVQERFGARVREHRVARGLTPVQLAWRADIPAERIELIEAGRYDPDLEEIDRIAKVFEVPLATLLDDLTDDSGGSAPIAPPGRWSLRSITNLVRRLLGKR